MKCAGCLSNLTGLFNTQSAISVSYITQAINYYELYLVEERRLWNLRG